MPRTRRNAGTPAHTTRIKPARRTSHPPRTLLSRRHKGGKSSVRIPAMAVLLFFVLGGVLLLFPTAFRTYTTNHISSNSAIQEGIVSSDTVDNTTTGFRIEKDLLTYNSTAQSPLRIIIPSLEIDLSVREAKIVNGFWELSETTASHGAGSANPGQNGNIVIFAHAREKLFLPLRTIKPDAIIYVLTKDTWHRYQVLNTKIVNPDDVMVIAPTTEETLTLFTCSGFMDSKRLIVAAKPYRP